MMISTPYCTKGVFVFFFVCSEAGGLCEENLIRVGFVDQAALYGVYNTVQCNIEYEVHNEE